MDVLHLKFLSPTRLTRQRYFQMHNDEAVQILEDLNTNFQAYLITEEMRDYTESACIIITHVSPLQPNDKQVIQYDLCIQQELLWFIRTHQMPSHKTMDESVYQ